MPAVLNLNNEVIKLRAEVKRVRVLIIRKLIRQISVLEKKKGSQEVLERHSRRVARLVEEIKELKVIEADKVTKTALQKDISFEKVCKNKEASLSDRAIARIATHPQFNKKIQNLKDAIKAFKDERINTMNTNKKVKKNADDMHDQLQEGDDDDDDDPEKVEDEEKKLNENKDAEMTAKPHEDSSVPEVLLKMRRDVKTTRVLVLGKLTRRVSVLKKKKVSEAEVKSNQELIAELIKDIQALRSFKPDQLTMTALEQNIDLAKVLQDPQASPTDRVIAHIVTHSSFINKLQKVKNTIEEKRAKATCTGKIEIDIQKSDGMFCMEEADDDLKNVDDDGEDDDVKENDDGEDDDVKEDDDDDDSEDDKEEDENDDDNNKEEEDEDDVIEEKPGSASTEIPKPTESTDSDAVKLPPIKVITPPSKKSIAIKEQSKVKLEVKSSKSSPKKSLSINNTESKLPMSIKKTDQETENTIKPQTKAPSQKEDEESDLSDNDEEKEYFDDSTEERFRKQSSQSEESDEDDFFLCKVSKFKKRKSKVQGKQNESQTTNKPQEPNPGKLQSALCSALSKAKTSSQKHGFRHDGPRPRFQRKGPESRMKPSVYKDPGTDRRSVPFKPNKQTFNYAGKRQDGPSGAGRGRSQFEQHQNSRGPPGKTSNTPQQSLHPSWEASRKRKEQQGQIIAFQGKKIRFDDD